MARTTRISGNSALFMRARNQFEAVEELGPVLLVFANA